MGASAKVIHSTITGNRAYKGGGVGMDHYGMLSNCLVTANTATNSIGGGVDADSTYGTNWIVDCTIAGNLAQTGGGGLHVYGNGTHSNLVQNCLIYGNTNRLNRGGGILLSKTGLYPCGLINCTIAGNESGTVGGGLFTADPNNYIANCIIYGNTTTNDAHDEVYVNTASDTNNFWYNCTPFVLPAGQGNTESPPLFVDAANSNYRLAGGSPGINTGTNMPDWMTDALDLDGKPRIRYGTVDMGAFEHIYSGAIFSVR